MQTLVDLTSEIQHFRNAAESERQRANMLNDATESSKALKVDCLAFAERYEQIANWLEEQGKLRKVRDLLEYEITGTSFDFGDYYDHTIEGRELVLGIIDKVYAELYKEV